MVLRACLTCGEPSNATRCPEHTRARSRQVGPASGPGTGVGGSASGTRTSPPTRCARSRRTAATASVPPLTLTTFDRNGPAARTTHRTSKHLPAVPPHQDRSRQDEVPSMTAILPELSCPQCGLPYADPIGCSYPAEPRSPTAARRGRSRSRCSVPTAAGASAGCTTCCAPGSPSTARRQSGPVRAPRGDARRRRRPPHRDGRGRMSVIAFDFYAEG